MVHFFFYTCMTSIALHLHSFKKVRVKKGWDVKNESLGFEPKQIKVSQCTVYIVLSKMLKMLQVNITAVFTENCIFVPGMQAELTDEHWPLWYVPTSTSANTAGNWNVIFGLQTAICPCGCSGCWLMNRIVLGTTSVILDQPSGALRGSMNLHPDLAISWLRLFQ